MATKNVAGRTRLDTLFQEGCGKIRLPNTHSSSLEAVLINTAGGITGGDRLDWQADVSEGGHLVLTTQACERSYRSTGDFATVSTRLEVAAGAHLDWLPQETILFAGSKLDRVLEANLADGATLTAIESVILGRDAMGEDAADALLHDRWRIRRNGRLLHAEATRLEADPAERNALSLLSGNRAFATILHIAPDADVAEQTCMRLRTRFDPAGAIAASANGERLVIRAMAPTGLALRRLIVPVLLQLSGAGTLPRLWHL
ncbi:urease accessory protein UreD [Devosia lucknowensis]|uniref:urease accessory protein UreD n=1 Tax=Devosia lucknowensis TaxID=1096929 RepID=UPI001FCD47C8|nr:urease accessory protein UreD [Devosia lucknowensis]